ncbi:MAG: recombinase-like helix-turn-helix domain-containing protein [Alphaproteobacteria bacterium]
MDDIKGDDIMLTVFLKHDQSQALDEFQTKLDDRGWWDNFPPEGVEVVSWNVVMGIGQIATLRMPPSKIQAVNVALEKYAWGVFRTETFATYDFMAVRERLARESRARAGGAGTTKSTDGEIDSGAGGSDHPRLPHNGLYMEQWQAGDGNAGPYEQSLGDALEETFGQGIHELAGVVAALNAKGLTTPDGDAWTEENFKDVMEKLGR